MSSEQIIKRTFAPAALVGNVYARERGTAGAPMPIGNVLALELSHKEDVQKQTDMTALGGGTHAEIRRVTDVEIKMTMADINVTNLARASLGTVRGVDAGTVSGEAHVAALGGLLRTAHVSITNVVLTKPSGTATVSDEAHTGVDNGELVVLAHANPSAVTVKVGATLGAATTVAAAGNYTVQATGVQVLAGATDIPDNSNVWISYTHPVGTVVAEAGNYEVRPAGIYVLPDAAGLADGDQVSVAYEYASYAVIEALTTKAKELELIFEGLNEADDGKPAIVEIWRASQGVASSIGLLAEKGFMNLPVTGAVLKDESKTGAGISKYYRVSKT